MNNVCKILLILSLISVQVLAYAQDSPQTESVDSIGNQDTIISFNALEYSLQKRYRPQGEKFRNKRFTDNMYIMLFGGIEKLNNRSFTNFEAGPSFGVSVGKWINPHNSLRATLAGGWFGKPTDQNHLSQVGLQLDHLFNLSSYINGYNPKRIFELSTVEGLGYHLSFMNHKINHVGELHLGLQLKIHPSSRMDIIVEPRATFYSDNIDHSARRNWHRYDLGYGALIGLNYRFTPSGSNNNSRFSFANSSFAENLFFNFGTGIQFPGSSETLKEIGMANAIGPHLNLSVGKWFMPLFGLRLSAYASFDKWRGKEKKGEYYLTAYGGGRFEAMINLLSFFNIDEQHSKFALTALVGAEVGKMYKETEPPLRKIRRSYTGLTGGLQAKYYINNNMGVFIEPRFSQVPYALDVRQENSVITQKYNYKDNVYNINVGIELRRRTESKKITSNANRFTPNFFVSALGGFNLPVMLNTYAKNIHYQVGLAGGRSMTPSSTLRLGVNYARHFSNNGKKERQTTSVALDYMYNLTNFFLGSNSKRIFNAELVVGPIATFEQKASMTHFGGEVGVNFSCKTGKDFNVFLEPMMRIYTDKFIPEAAISDKATFLPSLSAGVSYRLPW